jgi:hypothetical protein
MDKSPFLVVARAILVLMMRALAADVKFPSTTVQVSAVVRHL